MLQLSICAHRTLLLKFFFNTGQLHHVRTAFGIPVNTLPKLVTVQPLLRRNIIAGNYVNLAALLIPAHEISETRSIIDLSGNEIKIKGNSDPRLNKILTLNEFLTSFGRYTSVMCEVYPQRGEELHKYQLEIVDMANTFGGSLFYEYHVQFATKAAAWIQQHNVKVDWSIRDTDIFMKLSAGRRAAACTICHSTLHMVDFCPQRQFSTPTTTESVASRIKDVKGRQLVFFKGKQVCNNFNDSHVRCTRLHCNFQHVCTACKGDHALYVCTKSRDTNRNTLAITQ